MSLFKIFPLIGEKNEMIIAPRPTHGKYFKHYFAYGKVIQGSRIYEKLIAIKNHEFTNEELFEKALQNIEYSWKTPESEESISLQNEKKCL